MLSLFRKGNELANAEQWKDGGNAATLLVPFLVALVKLAGDFNLVNVQLSTEEATTIALGIVSAVQFVVHNTTSKRAGILPAVKPAESMQKSTDAKATKQLPSVNEAPDNKFDGDIYKG